VTNFAANLSQPWRTGRIRLPALRGPWSWERIVLALLWVFVACGAVSLIEPSPYDLMFVVTAPLWAIGGFRLHRSLGPILFLWVFYLFAGFLALMPYVIEPDPVKYQFQTLYLICTVIFFTIFFSQNTAERLQVTLRGFTFGAVLSALFGLLAYMNVGGLGATMLTEYEGRLNGMFKDPNVLGSYLILAACYLAQRVLLADARRPVLTGGALLIVILAIFLTFSRGSWGATTVALTMVFAMSFLTCGSKVLRQRMIVLAVSGLLLVGGAIAGALSNGRVDNLLHDRFTVAKDYDEGPNGRFGNQLRSIPMLLERPLGFGPLRFRLYFGLEPHNSYVNSFASFGWLGGFTWFTIVGWTMVIGFRLMLVFSPYQRFAQVYWPTLFVLLMQGFQIDIDHWRQVFLCFGAIWGLEAARLKWLADRNREAASPTPA
jgi:hypothetical protein